MKHELFCYPQNGTKYTPVFSTGLLAFNGSNGDDGRPCHAREYVLAQSTSVTHRTLARVFRSGHFRPGLLSQQSQNHENLSGKSLRKLHSPLTPHSQSFQKFDLMLRIFFPHLIPK